MAKVKKSENINNDNEDEKPNIKHELTNTSTIIAEPSTPTVNIIIKI